MKQELYDVFEGQNSKGKTVAKLDQANLERLLKGTYRIHKKGRRWIQRCDWVRIYERAPNGPWAVRIDHRDGSTLDFPVQVGSKDGVPLWLHGGVRNLFEAYVFVMATGQTTAQRSCARIWVAMFDPASSTARPPTYIYRSTTGESSEPVMPCGLEFPTMESRMEDADGGPRITQDDEAEGYHED
ncbi:MAG: hypothetical protein KF823_08350 [Xanthomonadales bacterium]|nr:hypothetical protein [Xanthomonadales bacterium]